VSPFLPEECDTPESQREFHEDLDRAIDEQEANRPTAAELAADDFDDWAWSRNRRRRS
jgi:hypothetical protein